MKFLEFLFILMLTISSSATYAATELNPVENQTNQNQKITQIAETPVLMGFQEWKSRRVMEAKQNLEAFKSPNPKKMEAAALEEPEKQKVVEDVEKDVENSEGVKAKEEVVASEINEKAEELRQLEFNLEIAQGLTIHDYFALYLKDKSKPQMESAIQKLTAGELSELLMAYKTSLYGLPLGKSSQKNLK